MLNTASAVISFVTALEKKTTDFYDEMALKYPEGKEIFLVLAKENRQNTVMVVRAYYGVITDALEACFSFEGLDAEAYSIKTKLAEGASYAEALEAAIAMEKTILKLYVDAATYSDGLMADVPRTFRMVAKKKSKRIVTLEALVQQVG